MITKSYAISHKYLFDEENSSSLQLTLIQPPLSAVVYVTEIFGAKNEKDFYSLIDCREREITIVDDVIDETNPVLVSYKEYLIECASAKILQRRKKVFLYCNSLYE